MVWSRADLPKEALAVGGTTLMSGGRLPMGGSGGAATGPGRLSRGTETAECRDTRLPGAYQGARAALAARQPLQQERHRWPPPSQLFTCTSQISISSCGGSPSNEPFISRLPITFRRHIYAGVYEINPMLEFTASVSSYDHIYFDKTQIVGEVPV